MPVGSVRFRRRSDRLWLLGAGLLVALVLLNTWRGAISERLLPDPRLNRNLERAALALRRGELSRADGRGARELFESVLATDPDQMQAREGLLQVREAAIARAAREMDQHRLQAAARDLALAQALSAPLVQLQPLRARLRSLEEASVDVPGLLARAAAPGVGDEQALALLDQVLALDAGNALALEGRRELFSQWLLQAGRDLDAGRIEPARKRIERVLAEDPAHVDLPPLRARLGEALSQRQRGEQREIARAHASERAGRLDAAAAAYARLAPDNAEARAALARLAERAAQQAERAAADFQFERAESLLAKARRWQPQAPAIASAQSRLRQARATRQRFPVRDARAERERVPALLAEAEQAMTRGEFLTPPGASAWDKLRVAAAIAPEAPALRAMQREFARRSEECFGQAMVAGHLMPAQSCLEAWLAQEPAAARGKAARLALAERWLAYAEERIGASDWKEAERALAAARRWQPLHPRLRAVEQRLRRARGAER